MIFKIMHPYLHINLGAVSIYLRLCNFQFLRARFSKKLKKRKCMTCCQSSSFWLCSSTAPVGNGHQRVPACACHAGQTVWSNVRSWTGSPSSTTSDGYDRTSMQTDRRSTHGGGRRTRSSTESTQLWGLQWRSSSTPSRDWALRPVRWSQRGITVTGATRQRCVQSQSLGKWADRI